MIFITVLLVLAFGVGTSSHLGDREIPKVSVT